MDAFVRGTIGSRSMNSSYVVPSTYSLASEANNLYECVQTMVQVHDAPLAGKRAQSILTPILLRRTKDSKLDGKPLLTLPPKTVELEMLQFSPEEREVHLLSWDLPKLQADPLGQIYDDFEKQAKIRVNKFIREGTIVQKYAYIYILSNLINLPWV